MTIEERILISLDDIAGIVFECRSCHARITRSPDVPGIVPQKCGQCEGDFYLAATRHADRVTHDVMESIRAYRKGVSDGFILRFEINGKEIRQSRESK